MAIFFKAFVIVFLVPYIYYHTLGDDCDAVEKLSSTELRDVYRHIKKKLKDVESALGFTAFECNMNVMKLDWELIWPECVSPGHYKFFTEDIMRPSFTNKLNRITVPFLKIEKTYSVLPKDGARKKIGSFFRFIYACLTRYNNKKYLDCLTPKGLKQTKFLRELVLKKYGLTEEDSFEEKDAVFVKFAFLYAVNRYVCNGYYHVYSLTMRLLYNKNLPKLIHSIGLLSAWNLSSEDIDFINELYKNFAELSNLLKLFPMDEKQSHFLHLASVQPVPLILKGFYSFEYKNEYIKDEKEIVSGFLPYLDVIYCPRFSIPFKGSD